MSGGLRIHVRLVSCVMAENPGLIGVLSAQWGPAISKNPFLSFRFKGGAKGDKVQVTWVDTKGETRTDEATIA